MSFYADPSFFVALAAAVAGAAFLGLREKPLKRYGLAVSVVLLALTCSRRTSPALRSRRGSCWRP